MERGEGKRGAGVPSAVLDMHNANDMHVKWKNKLTATEQ